MKLQDRSESIINPSNVCFAYPAIDRYACNLKISFNGESSIVTFYYKKQDEPLDEPIERLKEDMEALSDLTDI